MVFVYTQAYIVVGAFIVRDDKVLFIQENHYPDQGKWNIPAGKLDFSESPLEAAAREVYEEAGLHFTPQAILGIHSVFRKDVPGEVHALRIVFSGEATGKVNLAHNEIKDGAQEISAYRWLSSEEILKTDDSEFRYHDIKNLTKNYLNHTTYPLALIKHIVQESSQS